MAAVNTFRPSWTRRKAGIRLGIDGFGLVLVCLLLALQFHTGTLVEVASATGSATALARLAKWLNLSCAAMLVTAGISFVAHSRHVPVSGEGADP